MQQINENVRFEVTERIMKLQEVSDKIIMETMKSQGKIEGYAKQVILTFLLDNDNKLKKLLNSLWK